MKNLKALKLIATIAIGAIAASSANAAMIQGDINIDGTGTLDNSDLSLATKITNITSSLGNGTPTGDYAFFAGYPGDFNFQDIDWGTAGYTGALSITNLWSVNVNGVTYSFDLVSITTNQVIAGTLVIQGTGTAKATGSTLSDNPGGTFRLSSSSSGSSISFTSNTSVPDSGHTAALLGLGMLGLAGLAKRLRK